MSEEVFDCVTCSVMACEACPLMKKELGDSENDILNEMVSYVDLKFREMFNESYD